MNLLLDTHAVIWWLESNRRLSRRARQVIANAASQIYFSAVTAWEIENKLSRGKLSLAGGNPHWDQLLDRQRWRALAVNHRHAALAGSFPQEHRDPADRFLAAQASIEGLTLVTLDEAFADFPIDTLW